MILKRTAILLLLFSIILSVSAAAQEMSVTFKDGAKQIFTLTQPAVNISKIELGTGEITGSATVPAVTAAGTSSDPAGYVKGFEGKWNSKWGVLTFAVYGMKVIGDYTYNSGKIEANLAADGKTMEGTWSEAPTYSAPQCSGKCTFTLSSDGNSINGHWWYGDGKDGGDWNGIKLK
ncbi:MAG: hypothetical protein NTZ10_02255 [Candidatus Saganbacteria bacterium]|nr:hypothetical protein [Candidatus Saganbacteria bacterium]